MSFTREELKAAVKYKLEKRALPMAGMTKALAKPSLASKIGAGVKKTMHGAADLIKKYPKTSAGVGGAAALLAGKELID